MTRTPHTIVITGASAGIGARAAVELAARTEQLVLVGRDENRLAEVARRADEAGHAAVRWYRADFSRLCEVRALADQLCMQYTHIDVLLNNAGLYTGTRQTTEDGHELTNQVNHLAPFLLTRLLREPLSTRPGSRVVMTGSLLAEGLRTDDLDRSRLRWSGWGAYKASKQANALFAVEFVRQVGADGPMAICCHPGMVRTGFGEESTLYRFFLRSFPWLFKTVEHGAASLVHLATHDDGLRYPGAFFTEKHRGRTPRRLSDPVLAKKLWETTTEMLIPYGGT